MKAAWILTPAAGLALGALGLASQGWLPLAQKNWLPLAQNRLQPLQGGSPILAPSDASAPIDVEAWKAQLAEGDLDLREQAFERAVRAARQQPKLREALESWAGDSSVPELAWTCRLVLREAQQASAQPLAGAWSQGNQGNWNFGLPGALSNGGQLDLDELLGQMQDLHGNLDQLFEQLDQGQGVPTQPQAGGSSRAESFQLRSGPDGVECEVTKDVDGEQVKETYRAGSLQELLEQRPELRDRIHVQPLDGSAFGLGLRGGSMGGLGAGPSIRWLGPDSGAGRWDFVAPRTPARTDILGVLVEPVAPERAAQLGLAEGVGLVVQRVEPGTLADVLGVRRGHVLVEIDGRALKSRDDLTAALSARAADAELTLVLIDRWGERCSRAWKPEAAAAEPAPQPLVPRQSQRF
jgi:hypothetical protein